MIDVKEFVSEVCGDQQQRIGKLNGQPQIMLIGQSFSPENNFFVRGFHSSTCFVLLFEPAS